MNIWILDDNGLCLFYRSYLDLNIDELLVSGLLAALNQFILTQFKQSIESIDMAGLRWIYLTDEEFNLIFVASDTKDMNAEIIRARLSVFKESFIKEYIKNKDNWTENFKGDVSIFDPFNIVFDKYCSQWTEAEDLSTFAKFFDLLGVIQQLLNLIKRVVEVHITGKKKENILWNIENLFENLRKKKEIKDNPELSKIEFSRDFGFNILSINLPSCDTHIVRNHIVFLIREVIKIVKNEIGHGKSFDLFSEEKIFEYVFNNIVLLKKLNLDVPLLQLFLLK